MWAQRANAPTEKAIATIVSVIMIYFLKALYAYCMRIRLYIIVYSGEEINLRGNNFHLCTAYAALLRI